MTDFQVLISYGSFFQKKSNQEKLYGNLYKMTGARKKEREEERKGTSFQL